LEPQPSSKIKRPKIDKKRVRRPLLHLSARYSYKSEFWKIVTRHRQ
jgi:hypothetical protein